MPLSQQEYQALLGEDAEVVIGQADQIVGREYALFGGNLYPLQLTLYAPLRHWTRQRGSQWQGTDIKLIWEPGRLGWGIGLARAFLAPTVLRNIHRGAICVTGPGARFVLAASSASRGHSTCSACGRYLRCRHRPAGSLV